MPEPQSSGTARSASKIMAAIFGSRILGLVREVVLNAIFGAGKELDAFLAAFRIPNLLRDLFAEGALSTAFVTTFSKKLQTDGREAAFHLANLVLTILFIFMGIVTVLGIFSSNGLVDVIARGFTGEKAVLTGQLTQILFPFILFVSLAAVFMGLLNSLGSFGLPASASMAFNLVSIIAGLGLGWCFDHHFGPRAIYGFAIGTVLGGLAQLLIQVPRAIQMGFRPKWLVDLRDPGLREVMLLMTPAIVGGAAVQVNVLVNTYFASYLGDGAVTWLNNAFRLMQLPIGMFGVAIATVTLPKVSRAHAAVDLEGFRDRLSESLKLTFFLTLPASAGLFLLAEPIISLIYQRGAFTAFDSKQTAVALQAYVVGLAAYSGIKVVAPAFYALNLPRIPLRVSLIGIVLNVALNWFFMRVLGWGLAGLPLATSLVALINLGQLSWALRGKIPAGLFRSVLPDLFKILAATALMAAAVLGMLWEYRDMGDDFLSRLMLVGMCVGTGTIAYFGIAWFLRLGEIHRLGAILQKRLRK